MSEDPELRDDRPAGPSSPSQHPRYGENGPVGGAANAGSIGYGPPWSGSPARPRSGEAPLRPDEERNWAMWSHLGALLAALFTGILGFVPPLLILQLIGRRSAYVRDQAVESLNFQLFVLLAGVAVLVVSVVTLGLGALVAVPLYLALLFAALIFMVLATVAATRGEPYRYPLNIRFVK